MLLCGFFECVAISITAPATAGEELMITKLKKNLPGDNTLYTHNCPNIMAIIMIIIKVAMYTFSVCSASLYCHNITL